jgi:putative ABC transport system substrate-binding protein
LGRDQVDDFEQEILNMQGLKKTTCYPILVGVVLLGMMLTACGDETNRTYTIGVVNPSPNQENTIKGFKEGMTGLGYVEGENVTYIYNGPIGADKLDAEAQTLVEAKVDLILSITTPATKAAQKATTETDIAVVFIPVTDPVGAGVVASLTKPGGNTTGVTSVTQEGKRLEWLLQVAPEIKQIYVVYNPEDSSPVLALNTVSETAAQLGVELLTREASTTEEAEAAFMNVPPEADAIFLLPGSLVNTRAADVYKIATELELPTSGPNIATVNVGALTAYGVDLAAAARQQAARLADQIFKGARPADLPVEIAEFYLVINMKTAQAIGLTIPDEVLRQADIIVR